MKKFFTLFAFPFLNVLLCASDAQTYIPNEIPNGHILVPEILKVRQSLAREIKYSPYIAYFEFDEDGKLLMQPLFCALDRNFDSSDATNAALWVSSSKKNVDAEFFQLDSNVNLSKSDNDKYSFKISLKFPQKKDFSKIAAFYSPTILKDGVRTKHKCYFAVFTAGEREVRDIEFPNDFKLVSPSELNDKNFLLRLNRGDDFLVSKPDADSSLKIFCGSRKNFSKMRFKGGLLLAVDFGEFGGYVEYVGKSGKIIKKDIANVRGMFEADGRAYFVTGLNHFGISEGFIFELDIDGNAFKLRKCADFNCGVYVCAMHAGKFYAVTSDGLYVLENLKPVCLVKSDIWHRGALFPNSLTFGNDGIVYIGMRSAIAVVNLNDKIVNYYQYVGARVKTIYKFTDDDISASLKRYKASRK